MSCPFLIREGRMSYCEFASSHLGRLFRTNDHVCRLMCQKHGPYMGREISHEQEIRFIREAWKLHYFVEPGALAAKVLKTYQQPADIGTPEEWPQIRQDLAFLYDVKGFKAILITGSAVAKNAPRPLKDLDISLWFESAKALMDFRRSGVALPESISGVKADYFYYIGQEFPDQFFVALDPVAKKLYLSRWFKLNLRSNDEDYEVIDNPMLPLDDVLRQVISKVQTVPESRKEWMKIRPLWEKAAQFTRAMASRGLLASAKHAVGLDNTQGTKAPPEVVQMREKACSACELLRQSPQGPYCGGCGCGVTDLSLLKRKDGGYSKLEYPELACPLKKEGFSNAT